jgi:hypothetical protein
MASTYTTGFGIEKIGSGEQDGAWGDTTNHNLDILDRIASYKAVAITTNADTATLTVREASPGSGTENLQDGMYRVVKFTGALDSACTITIAPNTAPAWFIIENATSGSQSLILSQGSGANVTVQNGKNVVIYCDGAGSGAAVVNALSDLQIATLEVTGAAALDGAVTIGGALTGSSTIQGTTITATTAFAPDASDGAALGTTALEFSDLYLADGAVAAFGDDQDVTLTHVVDTGLLLNSTKQLQFGDSGTYIHQSADGVLDLVSDTEIEINATTIDINGAVALSGAITGATNITLSGELDAATGDFSGAVDIDGALDVAGTTNLDVVDIDGAVNIAAATTIAAANKIQFRDAAIYLNSSADGQLDIVADTEIQIAATTIDINGAVALSGAITGATNITLSGELDAATGDFSGAVDIAGALTLGTDLAVAQGGTGAGTFAANGILYGAGTGAIAATAVGTDGHVLTSNGSGVAPTFQAAGGVSDIDGLSDALTNSSGGTIGLGTGALAADDGSANLNTAVGFDALNDVVTGIANVAVGNLAGSKFLELGGTFIGAYAGKNAIGYNFNTAVGFQAMGAGTHDGGGYNTTLGAYAMTGASATSAQANVCIGMYAGTALTTGQYNTFVGSDIGNSNTCTTGQNNITLGKAALTSSATVSNEITLGNTAITKFRIPGINFVIKDTTATDNYVLTVDSSGEAGWEVGGATDINGLSDGKSVDVYSLGLGSNALATATATVKLNTAVGSAALYAVTTGSEETALGYAAGRFLTTGVRNTLIGTEAGYRGTTAAGNTYVGSSAGYGSAASAPTGNCNTAVGQYSLFAIAGAGAYNTAVGCDSGRAVTTGSNNTFFGYDAGDALTTGSNNTIIGNASAASAVDVSNEITFGNGSIASIRCQVQTISSLSDRRDKKDIEELPLGIDFINTLKPVKFTWNMRDGAKVGQQEAGFIAQDLDEAQIDAGAEDYLSLVLKNNPEKLEASYGKLVPVLVKAVQDLSNEITKLKKEIENGR